MRLIDFQSPKLVAGCLVIDAGRVLLLRRAIPPRLGYWTFPGGYVDFGEMPEPAALRETAEEVGMHVTIERLLGVYADPQNPIAAVVVYLARPGRESPGLSDEASEVRYFAARRNSVGRDRVSHHRGGAPRLDELAIALRDEEMRNAPDRRLEVGKMSEVGTRGAETLIRLQHRAHRAGLANGGLPMSASPRPLS